MRGRERACDRLRDRDIAIEIEAANVAQRAAADELENEEVGILAFNVVLDAADRGIIQLRERSRLAQEAVACGSIEPLVGANALQRDAALQAFVVGLIDLAHAAAADGAEDGEVADAGSTDGRNALLNCRMRALV